MWTVLIVLLIIIVAFFVYTRIIILIDEKRYRKKYGYIFDAHKSIGYPLLADEQQFDILDNENIKYISKLTEYDFIPTGLLTHYINIKPEQYFIHLKTLDLKEELKFVPENLHDGFFINQTTKGFEYLFVERQAIVFRRKFSNYDKLIKYIVYNKLSIYVPKKYKYAWLKKYF